MLSVAILQVTCDPCTFANKTRTVSAGERVVLSPASHRSWITGPGRFRPYECCGHIPLFAALGYGLVHNWPSWIYHHLGDSPISTRMNTPLESSRNACQHKQYAPSCLKGEEMHRTRGGFFFWISGLDHHMLTLPEEVCFLVVYSRFTLW